MSQQDMDLLLWLHAEAVWQRDVVHRIVERMETGHVEFGGPDGERIHPDWCRECRVQALKDAIADIDRHATPIGLLDENDPEGSPHHYVVTVGALHRALGMAYTAEPCESERERLRTELDRAEASRRDWAAIAMLHDMYFEHWERGTLDDPEPLEPGANAPCSCLTPEGAAFVAAQPKWSLPLCAVHPEANRG